MNDVLDIFYFIVFIFIGLIGVLCLCVFFWVLNEKWKERAESQRAIQQGYRVKVSIGGHSSKGTGVVYTAGDIERKFDAHWEGKKFVVHLSMPYVGLYQTPDDYWNLMQERVSSELKRLLGDKVEIN